MHINNIKGSVEQFIYYTFFVHYIRSFVIVCLSVLVYIKQRSIFRRQRVRQRVQRRIQEMKQRRARAAKKYPKSIDLTRSSCAEDTSDIQQIHYLSSDSMNIVSDEQYPDFMDGSAAWIPNKTRPSASHSDSTQSSSSASSSIRILSYIPSKQYAARKKVSTTTRKKSVKSRKHQQEKPLASFTKSPKLKSSPSKSKSPRLTKAGNYMIYLTLVSIIILFFLLIFVNILFVICQC